MCTMEDYISSEPPTTDCVRIPLCTNMYDLLLPIAAIYIYICVLRGHDGGT